MAQQPALDYTELRQLRLPPLSQDERWLEIMAPVMNDDLKVLAARQSALVQEERQCGRHLIQLKVQKKEVLGQLLELSGQLQRNDPEAQGKAERHKALLERINEEIDHLQFKAETAPAEIQKLNAALLGETVELGYGKLLKDIERIEALTRKIQRLRSELLALNEEKFTIEEGSEALDQYLHAILGKSLSDRMDTHYGISREAQE